MDEHVFGWLLFLTLAGAAITLYIAIMLNSLCVRMDSAHRKADTNRVTVSEIRRQQSLDEDVLRSFLITELREHKISMVELVQQLNNRVDDAAYYYSGNDRFNQSAVLGRLLDKLGLEPEHGPDTLLVDKVDDNENL